MLLNLSLWFPSVIVTLSSSKCALFGVISFLKFFEKKLLCFLFAIRSSLNFSGVNSRLWLGDWSVCYCCCYTNTKLMRSCERSPSIFLQLLLQISSASLTMLALAWKIWLSWGINLYGWLCYKCFEGELLSGISFDGCGESWLLILFSDLTFIVYVY